MTNAFHNAVGGALKTLQRVAGVTVTYHRDSDWVRIDHAVVGTSRRDLATNYGMVGKAHVRDYLIPVRDLTIGGQRIEPDEGDTIKHEIAGKVAIFEVMSPGGDEPAWRYSDGTRTTYRVHVKQIGSENP